jgi:organic hydroperoxide reductase OsmC/OhrA
MQKFPHHYEVSAQAEADKNVVISSPGLAELESAPPAEFGGPGDQWSPETLLTAAVADCFILSFRAIARMSKFHWVSISCKTQGTLDRVERLNRFTEFHLTVVLTCLPGADEQKAMQLLEKAEEICLITNSLHAQSHLDAAVVIPR